MRVLCTLMLHAYLDTIYIKQYPFYPQIFGIVIITTACVDLGMLQGFAGMETTGHETDAVLIAIGVLIIIVAAFGCFGAWKESPKLLYIFAGCLIIIILLELSVGIAAAALRPQIEGTMKTQLRASFIKNKSTREEDSVYREFWDRVQSNFAGCLIIIILLELSVGIAAAALRPQIEGTMKTQLRASFIKNKSTREEDSVYREFWDRVQSSLECCGVTGPENYGASEPRLKPSFSCCPPDNSDEVDEIKRSDCLSMEKYYKEGCEDKVLSTVHSAGLSVIVCGILFCFLEVAGIILALWLAHTIKTEGKGRETA
ncbi:Tetraspanin-6 [Papilio machaon]|uniref:Tetraspanin-6 n=1 Tax=Papilio machaon TaxID=76193 RepID=A0A194QR19_PAPMA|nr:Tetraspanin-6 [Papilio machaon]